LTSLRAQLFNVKQALKTMGMRVLLNGKSKRYEMYKSRDIEILMALRSGKEVTPDLIGGGADDEEDEGEEEDGNAD
jgi:hypothetical protein